MKIIIALILYSVLTTSNDRNDPQTNAGEYYLIQLLGESIKSLHKKGEYPSNCPSMEYKGSLIFFESKPAYIAFLKSIGIEIIQRIESSKIENADINLPLVVFSNATNFTKETLDKLQLELNGIYSACNIKINFTEAIILKSPKGLTPISVSNDIQTSEIQQILMINQILNNAPSLFFVKQIDLIGKRTSLDLSTEMQFITGKISRYKNSVFGWHAKGANGIPSCVLANTSKANVQTIAHELAHLFKLVHVENRLNLMYPHGNERSGTKLNTKQCQTIKTAIQEMKNK